MAFDSSIAERCVFVAAEGKDSLVHLLGVEHLKTHEQIVQQPGARFQPIRTPTASSSVTRP